MAHHRAPPTARPLVVMAVLLSACGTQVADLASSEPASIASASAEAEASAAAAENQPIKMGALTPGVRYVLEGTPTISFVAGPDTSAFPAPGGVELVSGETTIRFATGLDEVYVEDGSHEPIADLTGTLAALERNNRITINDSGAADLAGAEVAYVDATVPFFSNEEGGAAIFSVESAPIVLRDLSTSRVMMLERDDGMVVVIVSAPEESDIGTVVNDVATVLATVEIGAQD